MMAEELTVNKSVSDLQIYIDLVPQINSLLVSDEPMLSGLSNVLAALNEAFDKISWIGFYFLKNGKLYLGPFQGKIACTTIELGKGVCGTAAEQKHTIIVDNVNEFTGHIACDSETKSEIVVPLISDEKVVGVMDLDSYQLKSFTEVDKKYLELIAELINKKYNLSRFIVH